ncbi:MAG: hypothetical protein ABI877_10360 [Gemmatimonadaceae bacterium]
MSIQFVLAAMGAIYDRTKIEAAGGSAAFAALPPILLVVFGAIWLYDRSKGGFRAKSISYTTPSSVNSLRQVSRR